MPTKVAIVHDWLTGYRGGEKVLEALLELFPNAPIYTLVHKQGSLPKSIESHPIHTSFVQRLPFGISKYRHFLPLYPLVAETLLPQNFDLIVSTSHAFAKSVRKGRAQHWCYIHSPMRYVWDRFDDYFGSDIVGPFASNLFFRPIAAGLRSYDRLTSHRVDQFVANSRFVASRVQNFYGRTASVIHPPVPVKSFFSVERKPEDFYLFFSALVPYKKADQAILACQKLRRKLVILGHGPELKKLMAMADRELIKFETHPTDELVRHYYAHAKALLFPGIEDFGIVPVEATASGLPVIGLQQGGLLDSQTQETCHFYETQTSEALSTAILDFEKNSQDFDIRIMREHSLRFSKERFLEEVKKSLSPFIS